MMAGSIGIATLVGWGPAPLLAQETGAARAWDLVTDAARRVRSVGVEELEEEIAAGALVVDLRETEERLVHGAIPDALHAPRGMLEFQADPGSPLHRPEFDPERRTILHCAVGARSALAAATLQDLAYRSVAHLEGGFAAWREAGKPVDPVAAPSSGLVARPGAAPVAAARPRAGAPAPAATSQESAPSAIDQVLEQNQRYAEQFSESGLPGRPPSRRLAVLTCLDCRVHVPELLGLELGSAHIIRNAGGVVTEDVLRSVIVSHHIGGTKELMIINNTKCGMLTFKGRELRERLERETGRAPVSPERFYTFTDLETNVREQIRKVRSHPWIPEEVVVRGFIYDVDTGRLREVAPEPDGS